MENLNSMKYLEDIKIQVSECCGRNTRVKWSLIKSSLVKLPPHSYRFYNIYYDMLLFYPICPSSISSNLIIFSVTVSIHLPTSLSTSQSITTTSLYFIPCFDLFNPSPVVGPSSVGWSGDRSRDTDLHGTGRDHSHPRPVPSVHPDWGH